MRSEAEELFEFRSGCQTPKWAQDGVTVKTTTRLGWKDRLIVLIQGRFEVETYTATEHHVGRVETRSCIHIPCPRTSVAVACSASRMRKDA